MNKKIPQKLLDIKKHFHHRKYPDEPVKIKIKP